MKNIILLPLVFILACQPSAKEEVDLKALKDEVFELHDEVMPLMGDLRRTRKSLMLQVDSIQEINSERAAILTSASDALDAANAGMRKWMQNFDPNFKGTDEEILKYLTDQKKSIQKVNEDMKKSLERGKELLGSN